MTMETAYDGIENGEHQRDCPKCQGWCVAEWLGVEWGWRCVNCGLRGVGTEAWHRQVEKPQRRERNPTREGVRYAKQYSESDETDDEIASKE
ncbi:MAG: hypothetical protein KGL39_18585 [Patescibacteria group bacterium]|nr:hypothetical protein [Patescibacteria group bacterium]